MNGKIEFRKIPGLPRYLVGSDGSIWSRRKATKDKPGGWKRMKPNLAGRGYPAVNLAFKGVVIRRYVHELVLSCFVGPRPSGMVTRHLDGNPTNNRLDNLAWGTISENHLDKRRHGTDSRGERNKHAKLTTKRVQIIRLMLNDGFGQAYLARRFKVSRSSVNRVAKGLAWTNVEPWHPHLPADVLKAEAGAA